ncbi:ABC transporter ATP-binding protein [Brucella canis]|uniref:ABC transporter ATP-binding protein n=1 Tax=Brucella canis TaxID=36855 RepID=UPI00023F82FA|nr:ABC transporter ATP-binding protein [Brucella canis]AEW15204.1 ABC transporter ATP-binding protein [Brucella canis HSK A52141]AHZ82993.1 spermidine/putrescine ABC transporter ATP-binding protein [Brucella canis]AIJ84127.1 ABC transporter family protein [Brucella canis]AOG36415.1 spermidine/putrescine ABC transporter ATP-binding protein [Brucella canis]AOG39402.1 spermidine/putrescine ABC transporter ATP-binding protein [Brucella canis]
MQAASLPFNEIRLERMSRAFGSHNALKSITLSISKGEFIALLGPSGCGKSTALNCIAGLLATTGGGIYIDEKRIDTLKPEDRGFGMVFQNYALFPHMSVRENVGFGLKMRGTPKSEIRKRVDEAIGMVRLNGQEEKLPGQLSGGQQQRVAIARAIVIEPPFVLMDEPLSNLDAKLRLEMRAEIRRIHNQLGSTTIYVTHDQDEALSLADRIVVLRDGEIRQVGVPSDLYERPDHLDVAEFMGYRNRLPGKVTAIDGERATISIGGSLIAGIARVPLAVGQDVVLAARPDDVATGPASPAALQAKVETIEYRGRDFVGTANMSDGHNLVFHASAHAELGSAVSLTVDPNRALIFPA